MKGGRDRRCAPSILEASKLFLDFFFTAPLRRFCFTDLLECQTRSRSAAISSMLRPVATLLGLSSTTSASGARLAASSSSLISSHALSPPYLPRGCETRVQLRAAFLPAGRI
jgi:hypothetical protein